VIGYKMILRLSILLFIVSHVTEGSHDECGKTVYTNVNFISGGQEVERRKSYPWAVLIHDTKNTRT